MDALFAARTQMAMSLGFHMIFAAAGIALPVLMLIAEGLWLRTRKPHYRELAHKWAKATGLLFAIGAVSGTALSFELGLLWPRFMEFSGSIIGPAFALEGFAFFIEAIFLGLYLYGWQKLSPAAHWWTGVPVAISGLLSGIFVVAVNAWMQAPVGFELDSSGRLANIDPWATFRSPFWLHMAIHSSLSCYAAVGFAVAGIYAFGILRGRNEAYHRSGLSIAMAVAALAALLLPLSGDLNGRVVAKYQPAKLAAMEALFETQAGAPLLIGGIPNTETREVHWGIEIPKGLSLLIAHDPDAVITGLNAFPVNEWPNVGLVHFSFQLMVACGLVLIAVSLCYWLSRWRRPASIAPWLLRSLVVAAPLGFVALEAGWFVTEMGRQPWTIYGLMKTTEAVTPLKDVPSSLLAFTALYVGLGVALVTLLIRLARSETSRGDHPPSTTDSEVEDVT